MPDHHTVRARNLLSQLTVDGGLELQLHLPGCGHGPRLVLAAEGPLLRSMFARER